MNIREAKHIHFTGIKGTGLVSLVCIALDLGIKVTGSDIEEEFVTDETLKKRGVSWNIGFKKDHLEPKPDFVVYTGAHGGLQNPEVIAAQELDIPVLSHFEALSQFAEGKELIAVCGVGGKTTTAAMIATILDRLGENPSYAIGVAEIPSLGSPGRFTDSNFFIAEADEYAISPGINNKAKFLLLSPQSIVITNISHDHPDIYPTFEDTRKVFKEFISKLPDDGNLIFNADSISTHDMFAEYTPPCIVHAYGMTQEASFQIKKLEFTNGATNFTLKGPFGDAEEYDLTINVPGKFNVYNATAALVSVMYGAYKMGEELKELSTALQAYSGCKRRFEKVAEVNGILFYDDYAHHPSEIEATLKAAREWFPDKRIVVVFQPHTYSRTKALFEEFAKSFNAADMVGISDIFASAREEKDPEVTSEKLAEEIKKYHPHPEHVGYLGNLENAAKISKSVLKAGDVFITLGAGDIYKIHNLILEKNINPEVQT